MSRVSRLGANVAALAKTIVAAALALIILFPVLWVIISSFKTRVDAFRLPPVLIFRPILENHVNVIVNRGALRCAFNSLVIASGATLLAIAIGSLASYAVVRFRFPGSGHIAFAILITRMIPPIAIALPLYMMAIRLGLADQHLFLIAVNGARATPLAIWLMRSHFLGVPRELEESAFVDGAGRMLTYWRIVLPLVAPGMAATMLFTFLVSWNDFLGVLILGGPMTKTLPVMVASFVTQVGILYSELFAGATITFLPMLIFGILVEKHLVKGLMAGALKS